VDERNWAGNYRYAATAIHEPASVDELRRVVEGATRLHALGSRHSFNAVADTEGELVHLGRLGPDIRIAPDGASVSVNSATHYRELARVLQAAGLALHNLGSLPHISIGGACSTGTHGSGDRNGNLSSAVIGLEIVLADGSLIAADRTDARFDGMVVALGALGVVTRLTLETRPSYSVRQDLYLGLPWDSLFAHFDDIMSSGYSVNVLGRWQGDLLTKVWVKTRVDDEAPVIRSDLFGAVLETSGEYVSPSGLTNETVNGVPGPWNERLAHFRGELPPGYGEEVQTEYMVDRRHAVAAIAAVRELGHSIDPILLSSEIRSMSADQLWLSPAYDRQTVAIHFTFRRETAAIAGVLPAIEEALAPFEPRPHWGKLYALDAAAIEQRYPRMADFRALARSLDPEAKFHSDFLENQVYAR
jgi:xylitol oxidase